MLCRRSVGPGWGPTTPRPEIKDIIFAVSRGAEEFKVYEVLTVEMANDIVTKLQKLPSWGRSGGRHVDGTSYLTHIPHATPPSRSSHDRSSRLPGRTDPLCASLYSP